MRRMSCTQRSDIFATNPLPGSAPGERERLEETPPLEAVSFAIQEPVADVVAVPQSRDHDESRQIARGALRLLDGRAAPRRHGDVSGGTRRDEPSAAKRHLAVVQVLLLPGGQRTAGQDGRTLRERDRRGGMGEGRHGEHDPDREAGMGLERPSRAREQTLEDRIPPVDVQRFEDRGAGIAEPAGQLEREDAILVEDGVEIHVPDVPAIPQRLREAPERRREEALRPAVGDERAHLARQLSEVARKEALVLEIEAGGREEPLAVEVRPGAYLDAAQVIHEQHARRLVELPGVALRLDEGGNVATVVELPDVGPRGGEPAAAQLEDRPARARREVAERLVEASEIPRRRGP